MGAGNCIAEPYCRFPFRCRSHISRPFPVAFGGPPGTLPFPSPTIKCYVALDVDTIALLGRLKREGLIGRPGAVVEIGAQQLANNFLRAQADVHALGKLFGVSATIPLPAPVEEGFAHGGLEHLSAQAPPSREFWLWLGYRYAAIDIDGSPGSIPLDLNFDQVSGEHRGRFDLVTNYGTTEHVANQLNAFAVIHDLAAKGGLMIHVLPSQGMMNHGLINYNPKFFWMLARSNGYRLLYMNFYSLPGGYFLPKNIVDSVKPFESDVGHREGEYVTKDCFLVVVLRKDFDIAFVPPIDVATGTPTDNPVLRDRYWTVFKKNAFDGLS